MERPLLTEALDFREECDALYALLATRPDEDFQFATLFKQWTIDDVLGHLHLGDQAVLATLDGEHAYAAAASPLREAMAAGLPLTVATSKCLNGLHGRKLLERWHSTTAEVARRYAETDAARRVAWGKVHMSARSCISARVMETWSHGQEIYDRLDQVRHDTDRIKGVAFLGVNTFGFTFSNRGLEPPAEKPFVKLTAPSGAVWT